MQGIIRLRLKRDYEKDGVLIDLDKWCVVEWPKNFQNGYDVDIREGQICKEAHISLNAYYIAAVRTANKMASVLGMAQYRDEAPLLSAFYTAFYDKQKNLFRDGENTEHISLVGNSFVYGFDLCSEDGAWKRILREDGTTTFEGWGKDTKWNTSLFHLTMSYAATFMADIDLGALFYGI